MGLYCLVFRLLSSLYAGQGLYLFSAQATLVIARRGGWFLCAQRRRGGGSSLRAGAESRIGQGTPKGKTILLVFLTP